MYPSEHYEAHRLLALENPNNRDLVYAWRCLSVMQKQKEEIFITAEEYEKLMNTYNKYNSESKKGDKCYLYGKPGLRLGATHTEEAKMRMSASHRKRYASGDIPWNKGLDKSDPRVAQSAKTFSDNCKAGMYPNIYGRNGGMKGKNHSEETKKKMSEVHLGVPKPPFSEEHKKHLSDVGKELLWYTDGLHETRAKECPEGWVKGRCNYSKHNFKNYKWWTNGKDNVFSKECPSGFRAGMTRKKNAKHM